LTDLLQEITEGKIQLPDFQRGWIWDDEHIRSLLVSIARAFPIGSIMLLETGGEARFQIRPVEGVKLREDTRAQRLILDGQQRLTSLTQVLQLKDSVKTHDARKREVERYYYIDIEMAMLGDSKIEEAIIGVDGDRTVRTNFGRDVQLDLSSPEHEYRQFYFPCDQILNSDHWEEGLMATEPAKFGRYMEFRRQVLNRFRHYDVPVIQLHKENSKEAVCLVFEKVNTGGVPLSVFELVTATFAADGFNLRDDWYGSPERGLQGRHQLLAGRPLLSAIEPNDFLQGITLLHTYQQHCADVANGKTGRELTAVSAKRDQVLELPLAAYNTWKELLTQGFFMADQFLRRQGVQSPDYLPYRTQMIPLAAVMVELGERWLEPQVYDKLSRWFWCGVFGELYGGAVETRIALDMLELPAWINTPEAPEPNTVFAAGFQESRLDTLRTRTSAAYRGLYVLLVSEGCDDLFWKVRIADLDHREYCVDIHHVFPRDWCRQHGISDRVANSIINKTPISYKANRMIGGAAPSAYLERLRTHPQVRQTMAEQDPIIRSHLLEPDLLRADDFGQVYATRKRALIAIIEKAMGKTVEESMEVPPDDAIEDEPASQ